MSPKLRTQTLTSLPPEKLRWRCDPASIPFETTAEVEPDWQATSGKSARCARCGWAWS